MVHNQSVYRRASVDVMLYLKSARVYTLALRKMVNVIHTKTMLSRVGTDLLGSQKTSIKYQRIRDGDTGGRH